jgi:prolyl 4-hydroxylase
MHEHTISSDTSVLYLKQPMIYQCDNWLTNDEINYILNINFEFVPGRVSSKVNDNVSVKVKPIRQCLVHRIEYGNNLYFDLLTQKMADFFNVKNIGCIEPLSIVKYNTGDYFNPHNDSWGYGGEARFATIIVYLNDDFQGGCTYFPKFDIRVTPRRGSALIFHYDSIESLLHQSEPVISGTKYILTAFVRNEEFSQQDRDLVKLMYKI